MESYMLGNIIADQLLKERNWPRAAAISMVLTLLTTAGVLWMMHIQKREAAMIKEAKGGNMSRRIITKLLITR
jgi:spermidine/putrescine transport system permease protein